MEGSARDAHGTEQLSSRFTARRSATSTTAGRRRVADINHDGTMDVVSGPFYYLGPDVHATREIYIAEPRLQPGHRGTPPTW